MDIKKKINNHYNYLISKYGQTKSGLGWRNNGLNDRYNIFLKNFNFKNKNILDFGCGFCDLFFFFKKKKILLKKYTGYEINKKIINLVKKKNKNINILEKLPKKEIFDIIISNGVHNFNYKFNEKIIFSDLKKMIKLSKFAIGISFLNDNVDYKAKYLYYYNEKKIISFIGSICKCSIQVDRSFSKYETFLIIKKK